MFLSFIKKSVFWIKRNSFFLKLSFSFFSLIVFVIISFQIFASNYILNVMKEMVTKSRIDTLEKVKNIFEQQYSNLNDITKQLTLDNNVLSASYFDSKMGSDELLTYQNIINQLKSLNFTNQYVQNISIYFHKSKNVLTQSGKYSDKFFFDTHSDMIQEVYQEDIDRIYPFSFRCREENEIVFSAPLPLYSAYPKASVYIGVKPELFDSLIQDAKQGVQCYSLIIDPNENIVSEYSSFQDLETIEQVKQLILSKSEDESIEDLKSKLRSIGFESDYIYSDLTHYSFVSVFPVSYISEKLSLYVKASRITTITILVISLLYSLFIIKKIYKPIKELVNYINICSDKNAFSIDEIDFINFFIRSILQQNDKLKQSQYMAKQRILSDTLKGNISSARFFKEYNFQYFNNDFRYKYYFVITIQSLNILKDIVIQTLHKQFESVENFSCHIAEQDSHTVCIILNFEIIDNISTNINTIAEYLKIMLGEDSDYAIGVGNCYEGFDYLAKSFEESLYAVQNRVFRSRGSVIYVDEVREYSHFGLNVSQIHETKLINAVKSGNFQAIKPHFDEIFSVFDSNSNSYYSIEGITAFFYKLLNIIVNCLYDMNVDEFDIPIFKDNIYKKLERGKNLEQKQEILIEFAESAAKIIANKETNNTQVIYDKMVEYIKANYTNDISLKSLSDLLNYSIPYLSFIFKQVSGELFVDFVNQYRISKAKELMKSTDEPISSIALGIGFTSANNFIRVFKKYEGITPGLYRKNK